MSGGCERTPRHQGAFATAASWSAGVLLGVVVRLALLAVCPYLIGFGVVTIGHEASSGGFIRVVAGIALCAAFSAAVCAYVLGDLSVWMYLGAYTVVCCVVWMIPVVLRTFEWGFVVVMVPCDVYGGLVGWGLHQSRLRRACRLRLASGSGGATRSRRGP